MLLFDKSENRSWLIARLRWQTTDRVSWWALGLIGSVVTFNSITFSGISRWVFSQRWYVMPTSKAQILSNSEMIVHYSQSIILNGSLCGWFRSEQIADCNCGRDFSPEVNVAFHMFDFRCLRYAWCISVVNMPNIEIWMLFSLYWNQ